MRSTARRSCARSARPPCARSTPPSPFGSSFRPRAAEIPRSGPTFARAVRPTPGIAIARGGTLRKRFTTLAALALAVALAAAGSSLAAGHAKVGGTLLFGAEQEPPCLNILLNDCNNVWAGYV